MIDWKIATLIDSKMVATNVRSLTFTVPDITTHKSGQHYDIRLTSEDGYSAERSYSAASAPEEKNLEFGIELLENGEVSPYLFKLQKGDQIEMRGPIGGHFVWDRSIPGPLVLIGGGSGMVPLMSMLRHHIYQSNQDREITFLVSAKTLEHVLYKDELKEIKAKDKNLKLVYTLTSQAPLNWNSYTRRVDRTMLKEVVRSLIDKMPMIYICGPTPFVEAVANNLVEIGFNPHLIKTERFGG